MKRRTILQLLGLAPVAACLPALPAPTRQPSQLVSFRATPGERVDIAPPPNARGSSPVQWEYWAGTRWKELK